nr:hypothetical protein [Tanacetum cinerariifolium]
LVRAATTASSLEAEQDSGAKTPWGIPLLILALNKEDTSKQGRIDEINADEDIALVSTHDDVSTQDNIIQDKGIEDVGEEEVVKTELVVEGSKKDEVTKGSLKRTGEELEQENA